MKTVAVYFSDPDPLGAPFVENDGEYARSYRELATLVVQGGARFCVVRGKDTFLGKGRFSKYWLFESGDFVLHDEEVATDIVLNKGEDIRFDDGTKLVNDPAFDDLCFRKEHTYERLKDVIPFSVVVTSKEDLKEKLSGLKAEIVVVKPPNGALGRGVVIGSPETILSHEHRYPLLLQEFIDTSEGIPGLMVGTHDSRIVMVGGEFAYAEYKIPKPGSLVSNVSLGGSYFPIADEDIPPEEMALARKVDANFTQFPTRIYSIDMCRAKGGRWMVIELNSPPGLIEAGGKPEFERYHRMLANLLLRTAQGS